MQLFGAVNTSIPGQNGFTVLPSAGYFSQKLSGANVAPIGDNLVLTTDYIISEIGGSSNEIYAVDSAGLQVRLEPVFATSLPSSLQQGKAYICTLPGFGSSMYFSPLYLNYEIRYKIACYASVVSTEMLNVLLAPGKITFKIFGTPENKFETLCDGKLLEINEYPLYAERVLKTPGLLEKLGGDGTTTVGVPNFKDVFPLLVTGASDITALIPGTTETRSTVPKAAYIISHTHQYGKSNYTNGKKNDAAGVTGPSPNQGGSNQQTGGVQIAGSGLFDNFIAAQPDKIVQHEWLNAPPYGVLYPFITIR